MTLSSIKDDRGGGGGREKRVLHFYDDDIFFRGIIRFDSYRFPLKLLLWHCTSIQFPSFLFTS